MAYDFYVSIEGTRHGKFKRESPREAHAEKISGLSYVHEIKSPRDVATGRASGKRQHGAITINKEWGPSSPQLFQALVTNEELKSVLFEFIHSTPDGQEEVYHTIKLSTATVSSIRYMTGTGGDSSSSAKSTSSYDTHELEEVSFTYQRIEVENLPGQTSAQDDWTQ